jgi:hypothetical protein
MKSNQCCSSKLISGAWHIDIACALRTTDALLNAER